MYIWFFFAFLYIISRHYKNVYTIKSKERTSRKNMEVNIFMDELKKALVKRGVPEQNAVRHTDTLRRSFDSEDLEEIKKMDSAVEIEALADSAAEILMRKVKQNPPENQPQTQIDPPVSPVPVSSAVTVQGTEVSKPVPPHNDDYFEFEHTNKASSRGKTIFWIGLFITLPITLAVLLAVYGAFAAVFALIIGAIIVLVAGMIALIAGGAVCSLVGIIYGITQLFSFVEAGIYEIGLGAIVAGSVLLLSVLIFNLAIRVMPVLITKFAKFVTFVTKKIKDLFYFARRECYQL